MASEGITEIDSGLIETNYDNVVYKFDDLNLKPNIVRGIFGYGYETPSAIQQRAILPITEGRDVLAQAQSGTGKTATFTISALQRINENEKATQALILANQRIGFANQECYHCYWFVLEGYCPCFYWWYLNE